MHILKSDEQLHNCLDAKWYGLDGLDCLSYEMLNVSSSLVHAYLQMAAEVLNSPCHWLLRMLLSGLLHRASKVSPKPHHFGDHNLASKQLFNCWYFFSKHIFLAAFC